MRLLSMEMMKFGPYKNRARIDFDDLGNGLLLFSGDTGAGKTMIFDAITYALFGKTSGGRRSEKSLACNLHGASSDGNRPFVELDFEHEGRRYTVCRRPEYLRDGNKNPTPAEAFLHLGESSLADKPRDVTAKVKEILNIDENQWRQIAMLPQGEFMELLDADGQKRSEILRRIFNTHRFEAFQRRLSEMYSESTKDLEVRTTALDTIVGDLTLSEEDDVDRGDYRAVVEHVLAACAAAEASKAGLSEEEVQCQQSYDKALREENEGRELAQKDEQLKTELQRLEGLDARRPAMDADRVLRDRLSASSQAFILDAGIVDNEKTSVELEEDIAALEVCISDLEARSGELEPQVAALGEREEELKGLHLRDNEVGQILSDLRRKGEAEAELSKHIAERERLSEAVAEHGSRIEGLQDEIESLKGKVGAIEQMESNLQTKKAMLASVDNELRIQQGYESKLTDHAEVMTRLGAEQARFTSVSTRYDEATTALEQAEELFLRSQAGLLAVDLAEGTPCPVCGSVHHPQPATVPDDVPDEKALKKLRKSKDDLGKERSDASEGCARSVTEAENLMKAVLDYLGGESQDVAADLKARRDGITARLEDIKAEVAGIQKALDESKAASEALVKVTADLDTTVSSRDELVQKTASEDEAINRIRGQVDEISATVGDADGSALMEVRTQLHQAIADLDRAIRETREQEKAVTTELEKDRGLRDKDVTRLEGLRADLIRMEGELSAELARIGIDIETLRSMKGMDLNALNDSIAAFDRESDNCIANVQRLRAELEGREVRPLEELTAAREAAKAALDAIKQKVAGVDAYIDRNRHAVERISSQLDDFDALTQRCNDLSAMTKVANGTMNQTRKENFEIFAQRSFFDAVLSRANMRLGVMSGNRYSLIQKEEGGRSIKEALDIRVVDNFVGKQREVGSLSGGESFQTALSLALGLSDTVQASAGGSYVEALFVDEGFGSLDGESLEHAIRMLEGLSESDILVGIISHVEALEERIHKQVHVSYDRTNGSRIEIMDD